VKGLQAIDESLSNLNTIAGRLQVVGGAQVYHLAFALRFDLNDAPRIV
jgi:hypothetical protein